ncbi:VWA domain-containing protein, partial [Treponema sp. OttesenSCG-928-L16]|nr:VWA domain-containing protein [Treponema sp. OttesenSCG-928-L16]
TVIALLVTLVIAFVPVHGQDAEPIDLVLLLDTSSSMYDSYQELSEYLSGSFLREFIRLGDTFHLLSFSGTSHVEISRRIEGEGDIRTIVSRLLLMYPVNPGTDIGQALGFARTYTAGIPGGRSKKIVFISDGRQDSPSSAAGSSGSGDFDTLLSNTKAELNRAGIDFEYVPVPLTGARLSQGPSPADSSTQTTVPSSGGAAAGSGTARPPAGGETPSQTGSSSSPGTAVPPASGGTASAGSGSSSPGDAGTPAQTTGPAAESVPAAPVQTSPGTSAAAGREGETSSQAGSGTSAPAQVRPDVSQPGESGRTETASPGPAGTSSSSAPGIPWPLIIAALIGILLLVFIIILMMRRMQSSPNRAMASAASYRRPTEEAPPPRPDMKENAELLASYAANQKKGGSRTPEQYRYRGAGMGDIPVNGPLMLSLFVEDQNTAIGRRNIHTVKSGYTFSVGGGKSDFLIFLVPMPPHIADVRFDGRDCTFIPRKAEYFPDIGSSSVSNCIGKTIRVISDKKYELHIRIERYQDPLEALNKLLLSINVPG